MGGAGICDCTGKPIEPPLHEVRWVSSGGVDVGFNVKGPCTDCGEAFIHNYPPEECDDLNIVSADPATCPHCSDGEMDHITHVYLRKCSFQFKGKFKDCIVKEDKSFKGVGKVKDMLQEDVHTGDTMLYWTGKIKLYKSFVVNCQHL